MKRRLIQRKKSTSEKCNTADTTPLRLINNGEQTSTSAIDLSGLLKHLSLVLSVTFGHATVCRIAVLALSAAIHFVKKNSAYLYLIFRFYCGFETRVKSSKQQIIMKIKNNALDNPCIDRVATLLAV